MSRPTEKPPMLGGQAVIEGVMMRAPGMIATAVRRADGTIAVKKDPFVSLGERYALVKLPLIRGAVGILEMLTVGIRTLNYSAEVAMAQESAKASGNGHADGKMSLSLGLTVAFSLILGVALFFAAPIYITTRLFSVEQQPFVFNLIAGGIRVLIFLGYLAILSFMKDIKRLFQYHGAEHKAVFAHEQGRDLTVDACRTQTRFHPRCGTSFMLVVMVVAIMSFAVIDALLISWLGPINLAIRLATHLPLLPLIGGVSYEFIRLSARKSETLLGRLVVTPGLWLQRITTKEPDDSQLEVAVVALRAALGIDQPEQERSPVAVGVIGMN
jgi:uncharacterized protein YqhQ